MSYQRLGELLNEYDERVAEGPPRTEEDRRVVSALVIELNRVTDETIRPLLKWHDATVPLIAALAIYGESVSLPALVEKARALNEAPSSLLGEPGEETA